MKTKSFWILNLVVFLTFISNDSYSQFKKVGIVTGINISNVRVTNGDFSDIIEMDNFKSLTGFNIGFLSQSSLNNIFVTDFRFLYTSKGCVEDNYKLRMHYLKMPLVFKIRIPIIKSVAIQGGFGPYIEYAFLAKETMDGTTNEDILSLKRTEDSDFFSGAINSYFPISGGISFGGDIQIDLPNDCFLNIGVNYELGVGKITNDWLLFTDEAGNNSYINPGFKSSALNINIAYLFDVTKNSKNSKINKNSATSKSSITSPAQTDTTPTAE